MWARWDWYQCTVRTTAIDVHASLLEFFPGSWLEDAPVRLGYGEAYVVRSAQGRHAVVQSGGRNVWPNVQGSGEDAPAVAAWAREHHPDHEVTRMDSCIDTDGTGAGSWAQVVALLMSVADEQREGRRVKVSMAGDWREGRGENGRTLYLGAESSAVRVRGYEKGKQLRSLELPNAELVPLDAVRIEVQVRPKGRKARTAAAFVEPLSAWGFARFANEIVAGLIGQVTPIAVRDVRQSNDERALAFMAKQYGAMLVRQASAAGSWAAVWARLERMMPQDA